jgi:hemerythrin superfamily protein
MGCISDTIKNDHRELEACYEKIVGLVDPDEKALWQNQFAWELARHVDAEELLVYPAVEKKVPNGKEFVQQYRKKHQTVC